MLKIIKLENQLLNVLKGVSLPLGYYIPRIQIQINDI